MPEFFRARRAGPPSRPKMVFLRARARVARKWCAPDSPPPWRSEPPPSAGFFFEFSGKYPKLPDLPDFLPEMPEYFVTVSPKICPNFEKKRSFARARTRTRILPRIFEPNGRILYRCPNARKLPELPENFVAVGPEFLGEKFYFFNLKIFL